MICLWLWYEDECVALPLHEPGVKWPGEDPLRDTARHLNEAGACYAAHLRGEALRIGRMLEYVSGDQVRDRAIAEGKRLSVRHDKRPIAQDRPAPLEVVRNVLIDDGVRARKRVMAAAEVNHET